MEPIKANANAKNEGNWVFTQQGVATNEGFRNVSRIWYPKTLSFEQGFNKLAEDRKSREDLTMKVEAFGAEVMGDRLAFNLDGRIVYPTVHAQSAMLAKLKAPTTIATFYNQHHDNGDGMAVVATALNVGADISNKDDKNRKLLFRLYNKGNETICRAVLSDSYSIVDNEWYMRILEKMIPGGRLSHWDGDADTLYGNVIIPDTIRTETDSDYGGMLSISNSEIGIRALGQCPSLFRSICMNGCIWGQTKGVELNKRHRGIHSLTYLGNQIEANLKRQIPLTTSKIDVLLITRQWKAGAKIKNVIAAITGQHSLGVGVARDMYNCVYNSKDKTAFGIIDAITRTAQTQLPDIHYKMDTIAGHYLEKKNWDSINGIAAHMPEAKMLKLFGMTA